MFVVIWRMYQYLYFGAWLFIYLKKYNCETRKISVFFKPVRLTSSRNVEPANIFLVTGFFTSSCLVAHNHQDQYINDNYYSIYNGCAPIHIKTITSKHHSHTYIWLNDI